MAETPLRHCTDDLYSGLTAAYAFEYLSLHLKSLLRETQTRCFPLSGCGAMVAHQVSYHEHKGKRYFD